MSAKHLLRAIEHAADGNFVTVLAIARVKSENVGSTTVLDKMDKTKVLRGIFSPATMAVSVIFLLDNITVQGLAFFLPTIVRTIYPGTSVISQQLRTVPPYVVSISTVLLFPYLSWKMDKRLIFFILSAPLMMVSRLLRLGFAWSRLLCTNERVCNSGRIYHVLGHNKWTR